MKTITLNPGESLVNVPRGVTVDQLLTLIELHSRTIQSISPSVADKVSGYIDSITSDIMAASSLMLEEATRERKTNFVIMNSEQP